MWFRTLAESVVGIKIDHGVTLEGPVLRATPGSVEGGSPWTGVGEGLRSVLRSVCQYLTMAGCPYPSFCCRQSCQNRGGAENLVAQAKTWKT